MLRRAMQMVALCAACAAIPLRADDWVYFGTRVRGPGQGIHAARFDAKSGQLTSIGVVAEIARPTWLTAHATLPVLYAVSELDNQGGNDAQVFSLAADAASGKLQVLNSVGPVGAGPTHLAFDESSKSIFVASYGSGQVSWLPTAEDGRLGMPWSMQSNYGTGPNRRQSSPHAHGVAVDPSHRFVLAADLGADRVFVYRFDAATRQMTPAQTPYATVAPGSGPRHLVFHPNGRFLFLVTELNAEVVAYRWDSSSGQLRQVQTLALDEPGFQGQRAAAHISMDRDGRYLYVSNRGPDYIVVYAVDAKAGTLREVQRISSQGNKPWDFSLDPSGRWMLVANHGSNSIAVFAVDPSTGHLSATQTSIEVTEPSNVTFLHARD